MLLKVLFSERRRSNPSFAPEKPSPSLLEDYETGILFYAEEEYKIGFYDINPLDFAKELRKKYFKHFPKETPSPSTLSIPSTPENTPLVFLCHAHEDKGFAEGLFFQLEKKGLRAWFDQKDLRGGDGWDSKIEKTIKEKVDYVVVLQSPNLKKRWRGYVYKEIRLGLDVEKELQVGGSNRFLIPVLIEPEGELEGLKHLQTHSLLEAEGVDTLVDLIKEDYFLRKQG